MSLHPIRCHVLLSLAIAGLAACGGTPPSVAADAAPSTIPTSPVGVFAVTSTLDFHVPGAAAPAIQALLAATDGPDDPSRFVVDRLVALLPDGSVKTIADAAAPLVAAYVNARLADVAPHLVTGLDGLATGLARIATHLGTVETLRIDEGGTGIRTITGVRFEVGNAVTVVPLAAAGLTDLAAGVRVTLDATGRVGISEHEHALPYGAILRLGLDRAVAPSVAPAAGDLAGALDALLDCDQLGIVIANRVGIGSATLYGAACRAAMTALAAEVDAQLAAIDRTPLGIEVAGTAMGYDGNGDGVMDELDAGIWTGSVYSGSDREPIDAASFVSETTR
ncbi:MAG TPA: hypothetical protein VHT91_05985 [Kofleriaceae bacterium]|jgi:hypothetical protein|nr:hypothetical protein [Kofleriaceae bacterium]